LIIINYGPACDKNAAPLINHERASAFEADQLPLRRMKNSVSVGHRIVSVDGWGGEHDEPHAVIRFNRVQGSKGHGKDAIGEGCSVGPRMPAGAGLECMAAKHDIPC
jgi:hypothetical protein